MLKIQEGVFYSCLKGLGFCLRRSQMDGPGCEQGCDEGKKGETASFQANGSLL